MGEARQGGAQRPARPPARKVVQMAMELVARRDELTECIVRDARMFVLCDDGSIWHTEDAEPSTKWSTRWSRVTLPPDCEGAP